MSEKSPDVDEYIAKQAEFAQPILIKIRQAFHKGCPGVEETIKWGIPYFVYKGMLGGMAGFKQHAAFGFWRSKEIDDPEGLFETGTGRKASMCNVRINNPEELPSQKILVDYVKRAAKLNEEPKANTTRAKKSQIKTKTPSDLQAQLDKNRKAKEFFSSLAPSHKRDYIEWITEAKRDATRKKRLTTTIEWLVEGKRRNWKYERC